MRPTQTHNHLHSTSTEPCPTLCPLPSSVPPRPAPRPQVRGLRYDEAAAQCHLVPHKAAKYVLKVRRGRGAGRRGWGPGRGTQVEVVLVGQGAQHSDIRYCGVRASCCDHYA